MPRLNLVITDLAQRTVEIDTAVYGNFLPIRVAEKMAMLDNLTEGRLISGFVRSLPIEYAAYGIESDESRGRFEVRIALLQFDSFLADLVRGNTGRSPTRCCRSYGS